MHTAALVRGEGQDHRLTEAGEGEVAGVPLPEGGLQGQQDVPGVLQAGTGETEHRLPSALPVEAGEGVGQDQVHRWGQAGDGGLPMPHSVAADEGVHGGLHEPRTHIRNEIDAVHTAALGGHQIPSTAGQQAHQHPVDDHTLLPEEGIQRPDPVAGVEQVVHQDHRPAEGVDGADLALQRRVARGNSRCRRR